MYCISQEAAVAVPSIGSDINLFLIPGSSQNIPWLSCHRDSMTVKLQATGVMNRSRHSIFRAHWLADWCPRQCAPDIIRTLCCTCRLGYRKNRLILDTRIIQLDIYTIGGSKVTVQSPWRRRVPWELTSHHLGDWGNELGGVRIEKKLLFDHIEITEPFTPL